MDQKPAFKIGDAVAIKHINVALVVNAHMMQNGKYTGFVQCVWFNKDLTLNSAELNEEALRLIKEESQG